MPHTTKTIELTEDLQAFAEECVRTGQNTSVTEVVYDALQEKKLALLDKALAEGIAELDAGLGRECAPEEFFSQICAEIGLTR